MAGDDPTARRSSPPFEVAQRAPLASAWMPLESQNTVLVMSAVMTSGCCAATPASTLSTLAELVISISAGIVTTTCRPDHWTVKSAAVTKSLLAAAAGRSAPPAHGG